MRSVSALLMRTARRGAESSTVSACKGRGHAHPPPGPIRPAPSPQTPRAPPSTARSPAGGEHTPPPLLGPVVVNDVHVAPPRVSAAGPSPASVILSLAAASRATRGAVTD